MVMFILAILLGAVFGVVRATIQLSNDMTDAQLAESRVNGFAQFCERTLRNLPANAVVRHRVKQKGNHYLSQLTFKGSPGAFSTQGAGGSEVMVIETDEQVDGYLTVTLRSMTATQALAWEKGDHRVGRRLKLLEEVSNLEWRFYRVQSGEWEPVWNERLELYPLGVITANPAQDDPSAGGQPPVPGQPGAGLNTSPTIPRKQRPQLMELRLTMAASPPQRWTFWVPPAETPSGSSSPTPPGDAAAGHPGDALPGSCACSCPRASSLIQICPCIFHKITGTIGGSNGKLDPTSQGMMIPRNASHTGTAIPLVTRGRVMQAAAWVLIHTGFLTGLSAAEPGSAHPLSRAAVRKRLEEESVHAEDRPRGDPARVFCQKSRSGQHVRRRRWRHLGGHRQHQDP